VDHCRSSSRLRFLCLCVFALLAAASGARAQDADYRNLDPGHPIAVEDAQPIEYRALELQYSFPHFTRERRGAWSIGLEPEFKWGIYKDLQFGLSSAYVAAHAAGRTVYSAHDHQLHLLYNFNQETRAWPALAIRPELTIRSGGLGSRHEHAALKGIVTKTLGLNRVHLNASYTLGPTAQPGRGGHLVNRYFYGAAYERTFPLRFIVLLADVYALRPIDNSPAEVVFEAGARVQLSPGWVLDAGVSTGAARASVGPDFGFTFGMSRNFSLRWLHPTKSSLAGAP